MALSAFEHDIGPIKLKGTVDEKTGEIKGEIGATVPGMGYHAIKPFVGSIKDGIHGKFSGGVGLDNSFFNISNKDGDLKAQISLPTGGHEFTIFELDKTTDGGIIWDGSDWLAAQFKVQDQFVEFRFQFPGEHVPLNRAFKTTLTYKSLNKLSVGHQAFKAKVESDKFTINLANGEIIEGLFPPPPLGTKEYAGDGYWASQEARGSNYDNQFGEGKVGQQEDQYAGIALPKVGFE